MTKPQQIISIEKALGITLKEFNSSVIENTYYCNAQSQVIKLNLESNKLSDISFLASFTDLVKLNLWNNNITDASPLANLTKLEDLDISSNPITSYHFLYRLTKLKGLMLFYNEISNIDFLSHLTNIEDLWLSGNNIKDISPLQSLKKLRLLRCDSNKIPNINVLKNCPELNDLDISNNNIRDIEVLEQLTLLQQLNLSNNQIIDISALGKLNRLTKVDLKNNKIFDISPLFDVLYRKKNPVNLVVEGTQEGNYIDISKNPTTSPPYNLLQRGKQATIDWLIANKEALHEIKILLVGNPEAGKTSVLKRLKNGVFSKGEVQTDGILIEKFNFQYMPTFDQYPDLTDTIAHFWDFGGQEIMRATHQFFLTKRSVYLLLLEARNDNDGNTQVRDWLKRITAFGGDSPIIILTNKIEINRSFELDRTILRKEFPQIKKFISISCDTGEGIEELKAALAETIPQTELFNMRIDNRWIKIKDILQNKTEKKPYLPDADFREICKENELTEKTGQEDAINFLHDLGILLHFEELDLQEFYVLDPHWVTSGVYEIITSPTAAQAQGKVPREKLAHIINEEESKKARHLPKDYKRTIYSPNEVRYIADIMTQFKLAYYDKTQTHLLIPSLFPAITPQNVMETFFAAPNSLHLVYDYDFLPNNILPRFMVEMHNDIHEYWRTGVVLHYKNHIETKAMVIAEERRIRIIVCGIHKEKGEYLSIIRYQLDMINSKLNIKKPELLIPLPTSTEEKYVKYIVLKNKERRGEKQYIDDEEYDSQPYPISILLEGIDSPENAQEIGKTYKSTQDSRLFSFKQKLLQHLSEKQQMAIADILQRIETSDYQYDKTKYTEINNGINPTSISLNAHALVESTKTLINSLK